MLGDVPLVPKIRPPSQQCTGIPFPCRAGAVLIPAFHLCPGTIRQLPPLRENNLGHFFLIRRLLWILRASSPRSAGSKSKPRRRRLRLSRQRQGAQNNRNNSNQYPVHRPLELVALQPPTANSPLPPTSNTRTAPSRSRIGTLIAAHHNVFSSLRKESEARRQASIFNLKMRERLSSLSARFRPHLHTAASRLLDALQDNHLTYP